MGRGYKTGLNYGFIIGTFLLLQQLSYSQTTIYGSVKDSGNGLYAASIILKDSITQDIITYTYSDELGNFKLNTNKTGALLLTFTSLGYETETLNIYLKEGQKELKVNAFLKDKPLNLDEIIIKADAPMTIKEDTISFKTKFYAKGNEQTVEELLKTIPGLTVNSDGTIKIGNQEIEKLMIDGDDLFEKGYKLLSKNMPAYPIEEVELLQNYANNRLLKGIEQSDKVALNLKLNEDSKRIWFGNVETGAGNDGFYQFKGNLMNFGKKNKYYFLTNLNNISYDATGDLDNLIRAERYNEPGTIGDNNKVSTLTNLRPETLRLKSSRTIFNNAALVSFSAIFNPTEKLKIKTIGLLNSDNVDFFKSSIDQVNVNGTNFTNLENNQLRNGKLLGFGKLDFIYDISKTKMFEASTRYNNGDFEDRSSLVFNNLATAGQVQTQNQLFDQKVTFTNKFKDNKVFLISGRAINEQVPQNYTFNDFLFEDLFPNTSATSVQQNTEQHMFYAGLNAHLIDRKENGNLLELQVGNEFRRDELNSSFGLLDNNVLLTNPVGFQNQSAYKVNDLYLKGKYRLKRNNVGLTGKLDVHQLFNELQNNGVNTVQQPFFINPSIGLDWKINTNNKITTSYSYNTTNAGILDVFSDFVQTGFRNFRKGTGSFNQLEATSASLNYQLGNWSDRFFANTFLLYSKNHDFFSSNTLLGQNASLSEKILIKDREFIAINSSVDYFFKAIESNLKVNIAYTQSEFKNIINNSILREVTTNSYDYGLELRSGFKGVFNYHLGTKWITNQVKASILDNRFTDTVSFLDLTFIFNDRFDTQIQSERYYFGALQSNNTYYFLDLDTRYKLIENKLTLTVSGKNLFNTNTFTNFNISDIGTSTTTYRLLPRYVLLKMEYRF